MRKFLLLALTLMYGTNVYGMDENASGFTRNINGTLVNNGTYIINDQVNIGASGILHNYSTITIPDDATWDSNLGSFAKFVGEEGAQIVHYDHFTDGSDLNSIDLNSIFGNTYSDKRVRNTAFFHEGIDMENIIVIFAPSSIVKDFSELTPEQKNNRLYVMITKDIRNNNWLEGREDGQNLLEVKNGTIDPINMDCNTGCKKPENDPDVEVINLKYSKGKFIISGNNSLYEDGTVTVAPDTTLDFTQKDSLYQSDIKLEAAEEGAQKATINFNASEETTHSIVKTLDASAGNYFIAPNNTVIISTGAKLIG